MVSSVDVRGLALRTLMPGFPGTSVPSWLDSALADGLGSVCLYGSNVVDREQLRGLCEDLRARSPRVVLAVDEEGGDVTRLHYRTGSPYPGNAVLGRLDEVDLTRASAATIGADLVEVGVDLDLAPVVDVNSSVSNPVIGTRSFGAEADLVARHGVAWVEGLQSTGVAACAKHFPGHGDTTDDSHRTLPVVTAPAEVLRSRELAPFAAAVRAGVACVMTAAVVVPALDPVNPATFSATLLQDVLRGELGFRGVIVTDALDMAGASQDTGIPEAAVRALVAGCDLLCLGSDTGESLFAEIVESIVSAVAGGRLGLGRLRAAADAVDALAARRPSAPLAVAPHPVAELPVGRAFALSDSARRWLEGVGRVAVVQVESRSNDAVGSVPWGPASLGLAEDALAASSASRVAVVGRDLEPGHPAWAVAEGHRAAGRDVVVVECGWPRGGADIVAFGGSPVVARALVSVLTGSEVAA